jgi:hypothetical protein
MNRTTQNRKILVRGTVILLIGVASCALLYLAARYFLVEKYHDGVDVERRAVEQLLKLAQTYPIGAFPKNDLSLGSQDAFMQYFTKDGLKCWKAIQNGMAKNDSQYIISGINQYRLLPDGDFDNVGNIDDSIVVVWFRDDSRVVFGFYQQRIVECFVDLSMAK